MKKEELNSNNKKVIKTVLAIVILIILAVTIMFLLKPKTPAIEQLKNDFIVEKLDSKDFQITNFEVESETDGKDDFYKAIVNVTYNNDKIEYKRQYHFLYNKYDEWILEDIENYEKDDWTVVPISAPNIKDFENECQYMLYESELIEYDKFNSQNAKTTYSLDEGTATFIFEVEKKTSVVNVSGEVEFDIVFDYEYGCWELDGFRYADSFNVAYEMQHIWKGKGTQNSTQGLTSITKDLSLEITDYHNGILSGTLVIDGNQCVFSGEANELYGNGDRILMFDFVNTDKKIKVEGQVDLNGEMFVKVRTNYEPAALFYSIKDIYTADLVIEE